jgi:hypothetical protein
MKEKITAAIKAKYPAINLSKKRLEQISNVIEAEVIDDETKIDAALNLYNKYNPLTEMASNDDKLRTAEKKLKETTSAATTNPTTDPPADDAKKVDDTPEWAKALMTEVKQLKAEKAQTTIQGQLKEKLKDVNPLVNWNDWKQPESDEEATAFIDKVTAKSKEVEKTLTEKGLSALSAPRTGAGAQQQPGVSATLKATLEAQNKSAAAQINSPAVGKSLVINSPGTL